MKLLLFSRKNKDRASRRQTAHSGSNRAPVMRYYRPPASDSAKLNQREKLISKEKHRDRVALNPFKYVVNIATKLGFGLILLGVIFLNFTHSGAVLKSAETYDMYRTQAEYKQGIADIFARSFLNRFKLTLNSSRFENEVKLKFPEVSDASVVIPLAGRQLQVSMVFSQPMMRVQAGNTNQAVLGINGTILMVSDSQNVNSRFSSLPLLQLPGVEIKQGANVLTTDESELLSLLSTEFDGSDVMRPRLKTVLYDIRTREIRASFDDTTYFAKLTPERSTREQVGSLLSTIKYLSNNSIVPASYVDVRVDDRVFVL